MKKRIFIIAILGIVLIMITPLICNAGINPSDWNPSDTVASATMPENLSAKVSGILGVISALGIIASVGALLVIGIKVVLGSTEEKAEYKKRLPVYIIGMVLVVSMTTLPNIIYNLMN